VIVDPGLQGERTELAWTRSSLSLVTCSLVAARLLLDREDWWIAVALVLIAAAGLAIGQTAKRYLKRIDRARAVGTAMPATAWHLGSLALLVVGLAGVSLAAVTLLTVGG